jgi:Icc-related predicted phosphoesterase
VHAGDFTNQGKPLEVAKFSHWCEAITNKHGYKHVIVTPGNHEIIFENDYNFAKSCLTHATVLNQEVVEIEGLKFYGEPRTIEFCNWAFNVPLTKMPKVWERVPTDIDVLITHGPPAGVLDLTMRGENVGCPHLRDWILEHQPKLVVCGHIHLGYGTAMLGNTRVVNAAICNERYKPVNRPIYVDL